MQVVKRILKEVVIAFLIVGLLVLIGFLLFRNLYGFFSPTIPNAVKYEPINEAEYGVVSDDTSLENQSDPTKRYEATPSNLRTMTEERRVSTGAPNPFVASEQVDTDLPSEIVTISNSLTGKNTVTTSGDKVAN